MDGELAMRRRTVADLAVVIAALCSVGAAVWGAPLWSAHLPTGIAQLQILYLAAGALGLLGAFLAQQNSRAARVPLVAAGSLLLVSLVFPGLARVLVAVFTLLLAAVMLGAIPFVGDVQTLDAGSPLGAPRR